MLPYEREHICKKTHLLPLEIRPGTYAVPVAARLNARLDPDLLAGALAEVLRRHEVLRSHFEPGPHGLRLVIDPPGPAELRVVDRPADPEEVLRRLEKP